MALDDLSIPINQLPKDFGGDVDENFIQESIGPMTIRQGIEPSSDESAALTGHAYMTGDEIFVTGKWHANFRVACARCLDPAEVKADDTLHVTFVPEALAPKDDYAEGEDVDPSEADVYPHDGETIDLAKVLRELIVLAVPFAPLCSEGCKGLCPSCGANLNQEVCECKPALDPRLQALQDIDL